MLIGILSDTHDHLERCRRGVEVLKTAGADVLVHCGDLTCAEIVDECAVLPFYFVYGNHDADNVPELQQATHEYGVTCLEWGGEFSKNGKRIAVVHGHMTMDLKPLLEAEPDYLPSGHSHIARDWREGGTRRINPGALYRASRLTVAMLDVERDVVEFFRSGEVIFRR